MRSILFSVPCNEVLQDNIQSLFAAPQGDARLFSCGRKSLLVLHGSLMSFRKDANAGLPLQPPWGSRHLISPKVEMCDDFLSCGAICHACSLVGWDYMSKLAFSCKELWQCNGSILAPHQEFFGGRLHAAWQLKAREGAQITAAQLNGRSPRMRRNFSKDLTVVTTSRGTLCPSRIHSSRGAPAQSFHTAGTSAGARAHCLMRGLQTDPM